MKRLIGAFGVVVVGLALAIANAADGDAVYIAAPQDTVLNTAAKRQALGAAALSIFPDVPLASIDKYGCSRVFVARGIARVRHWRCKAMKVVVAPTDAEALDLVLSGRAGELDSSEIVVGLGKKPLEDTSLHDSFCLLAFGVEMSDLAEFRCTRVESGPPECSYLEIVTKSPAQWRSEFESGDVVGTIGKVEGD